MNDDTKVFLFRVLYGLAVSLSLVLFTGDIILCLSGLGFIYPGINGFDDAIKALSVPMALCGLIGGLTLGIGTVYVFQIYFGIV